jgi:hypothetical protein
MGLFAMGCEQPSVAAYADLWLAVPCGEDDNAACSDRWVARYGHRGMYVNDGSGPEPCFSTRVMVGAISMGIPAEGAVMTHPVTLLLTLTLALTAVARADDAVPATTATPSTDPAAAIDATTPPASTTATATATTNIWAEKLDDCTLMLVSGRSAEGRACLVTIKTMAAGTPTGDRAAEFLAALDGTEATKAKAAAGRPVETADAPPSTLGQLDLTLNFGRAEFALAGAGLGVFSGIVGTGMLGATFGEVINPGVLILGGGIATTALGIGYGVGGYVLGDDDLFGENGARLATLGAVVGTGTAFALTPLLAEGLSSVSADPRVGINVIGGAWIIGGHAGVAAGLLASRTLQLDARDVTLITAGTAMSFATGLLVLPNLAANNVQGAAPYSLTLIGTTFAGIGASYWAGTQLDLEIVDTLLGLGGATLAASALSATMAAALPSLGVQDPAAFTAITTGTAIVGIFGGFAATVVPLTWLRTAGTIGDDKAKTGFRLLPGGAATVAVDMSGAVVNMAPLVTARW